MRIKCLVQGHSCLAGIRTRDLRHNSFVLITYVLLLKLHVAPFVIARHRNDNQFSRNEEEIKEQFKPRGPMHAEFSYTSAQGFTVTYVILLSLSVSKLFDLIYQ